MKPLSSLQNDVASAVDKLKQYVDEGIVIDSTVDTKELKQISYYPSHKKALKSTKVYKGNFVAVDCSTKPLMRGNRFGVYLLRVAFASVNPCEAKNPVKWGPCPLQERISAVIGDILSRRSKLERLRFEYESKLAETLLELDPDRDYLILDGVSYFGRPRDRRFALSLYEKAKKKGIVLLTISKSSPSLLDNSGRDFLTLVAADMSTAAPWLYHPIKTLRADPHKNRYGDVSVVRLNPRSFRVFRCDITDYLVSNDLVELLSPLTAVSDDGRCLGYPVSLYLAHDLAKVSAYAKLLHYRTLVERDLADAGLLDRIQLEERLSNFRSELYGFKYPWELEERQIV